MRSRSLDFVKMGLCSSFFIAIVAFASCSPAAEDPVVSASQDVDQYDVVILNGRIVDGTGNGWFYGDLGIKDGKIDIVGPHGVLDGKASAETIDASGHVVSPGFIDIQSHSRYGLLYGDTRVISKVTQGVTTEIMGEGTSSGPINPNRDPGEDEEFFEAFSGERGFDAWLRAMDDRGTSVNQGSFLGATTVRTYAMGSRMGVAPPVALDTMKAVVRRAMEDGAFGIASALIYPPGNFAGTQELIEIASAMKPYGGVYITHMRSEADQFLEAIDEAIEIGVGADVPLEIYHLKAGGRRNWHKASQAITKIDEARVAGIDVQANMYPYTAGGTGLTACFPPWASADGKLFDNLADEEMRDRIRSEVTNQTEEWENMCMLATPEGVLLLGLEKPENQKYAGRYLDDVANEYGKHWIETAMDLVLSEEQRIGTIYFMMDEDNVRLQRQQPWMKFGTDAGGVNPAVVENLVHPRAYGTYPRILGRYVRDEGVLSLEEAVRKMSSAVATRLSITDRGLLAEGFYADVVIFDPATVIDRATYEEPHQLSVGIRDVLVNGVAVVRDGNHTGEKPGMIVRGPGYIQ